MTGTWLRRLALALMIVVLALAALTARAIADGRRAMRLSEEAFDRGDARTALVEARRAAVAYAPGAPHVAEAYARMQAVALGAEATGDRVLAERAWRAMRGAALETRHVWTPHQRELEHANRALARLEAQPSGASQQTDPRAAYRAALSDLERSRTPRPLWVLLLGAGFACAAAGLGTVAWRGITRGGELVLRPALLGLALTLLGAACWTLAVLSA